MFYLFKNLVFQTISKEKRREFCSEEERILIGENEKKPFDLQLSLQMMLQNSVREKFGGQVVPLHRNGIIEVYLDSQEEIDGLNPLELKGGRFKLIYRVKETQPFRSYIKKNGWEGELTKIRYYVMYELKTVLFYNTKTKKWVEHTDKHRVGGECAQGRLDNIKSEIRDEVLGTNKMYV